MLKKLLILVVILVLLLVGAVIGVVYYAGSLAKEGIERGGTYALGVPTKVNSVNLGLLSGKLGISGLDIGNPSGFPSPHFLALGTGEVQVGLASLRESTIVIPKFSLDKLDVRLEKKAGKANYTAIMDNLKKVSGDSKPSQPAPSGGAEKKFIVNDLSLTNLTIHVDLLDAPAALGGVGKVTVPIDSIKLQNVGQTGSGVAGSGVTMSQLASIIVQAVMQATVEKGGVQLPGDILADLQGQLASLGDLKNLGMNVSTSAAAVVENVQKVGEDAKKAVDEGKKAVEDAGKQVEDVKKGIEGLLPKKK